MTFVFFWLWTLILFLQTRETRASKAPAYTDGTTSNAKNNHLPQLGPPLDFSLVSPAPAQVPEKGMFLSAKFVSFVKWNLVRTRPQWKISSLGHGKCFSEKFQAKIILPEYV